MKADINDTDKTARSAEKLEKAEKKVVKAEKSVKEYQTFILKLIAFLLAVWVLFFQIVGLTHMPGEDMSPRIDAGDMVLFYRLDKDVKAQDVVVLEKQTPDSSSDQLFISRVVAKGGDTVEITDDNRLVVNGNTMIENRIFYSTPRYEDYTAYPLTLAPDECFVLADAREGGNDSRYFGAVKTNEIQGTVITILRRNNL